MIQKINRNTELMVQAETGITHAYRTRRMGMLSVPGRREEGYMEQSNEIFWTREDERTDTPNLSALIGSWRLRRF